MYSITRLEGEDTALSRPPFMYSLQDEGAWHGVTDPLLKHVTIWRLFFTPHLTEVSTWNVLLTCFVWAPLHGGESPGCVVPLVREPTVFVIDPTKVTVTRVTAQHPGICNLQVGYWLHPTTLTTSSATVRTRKYVIKIKMKIFDYDEYPSKRAVFHESRVKNYIFTFSL